MVGERLEYEIDARDNTEGAASFGWRALRIAVQQFGGSGCGRWASATGRD